MPDQTIRGRQELPFGRAAFLLFAGLLGLLLGGAGLLAAAADSPPPAAIGSAVQTGKGNMPAQGTPTPTPACPLAWHIVDSPNPDTREALLAGVAVVATNDIWAVGSRSTSTDSYTLAMHWDGNAWNIVPSPNGGIGRDSLAAVAASSTSDVWAVGTYMNSSFLYQTLIERWNGTDWTIVPSPSPGPNARLSAVAVVGPNDIWAAGEYTSGSAQVTLVEHWDGSMWTVVPSPNIGSIQSVLYGLTVVAANDIWAVGRYYIGSPPTMNGLIEHWDGQNWTAFSSPPVGTYNNELNGIAASGPNDVWAVGEYCLNPPCMSPHTLIVHWDGQTWQIVPSPNASLFDALSGVVAFAPDDAWAVGGSSSSSGGQVLTEHWNGSAWDIVSAPSARASSSLWAIAGSPAGALWAVGSSLDSTGPRWTLTEQYSAYCTPPATNTPTSTPPPTATSPPVPTETPCGAGFSDVHPDDYFYAPVQYLACRQVVSGYADGTFRPYNNTTRAQQIKMVTLSFGLPSFTPGAGGYTFHDVRPDFPFFTYIETGAQAGIVSGYACGGPDEPCDEENRPYLRPYLSTTRGQFVKMTVNAAAWGLIDPADPSFTDVGPDDPFYMFVETAYCHGIISGYDCGGPGEPCDPQQRPYFRPNGEITRGQFAKVVVAALTAGQACAQPTVTPGPQETASPTMTPAAR